MKTFQRDLSGYTQFLGTPDPLPPASTPSDYGEHHQVQTGRRNRTVSQTGSTNNLAKETDIDAISMAIPNSFWGQYFTCIYANLIRRFFHAEVQDGGWIPEVVIIWRRRTIPAWSQRLQQCFQARPIHFKLHRHRETPENIIIYKPEVLIT